jgi:hypothetical protein
MLSFGFYRASALPFLLPVRDSDRSSLPQTSSLHLPSVLGDIPATPASSHGVSTTLTFANWWPIHMRLTDAF